MPAQETPTESKSRRRRRAALAVSEMVVLSMLGATMYGSTIALAALPNIHLMGLLITVTTVVYRQKALYPIYIFVMLEGVSMGFGSWWVGYLYVWTVLWGLVMLLPKAMPDKVGMVVYPLVAGLHGLLFGTLMAPPEMIIRGWGWEKGLAWIAAGLPYDITHAAGNVCTGLLAVPLIHLVRRLDQQLHKRHGR